MRRIEEFQRQRSQHQCHGRLIYGIDEVERMKQNSNINSLFVKELKVKIPKVGSGVINFNDLTSLPFGIQMCTKYHLMHMTNLNNEGL